MNYLRYPLRIWKEGDGGKLVWMPTDFCVLLLLLSLDSWSGRKALLKYTNAFVRRKKEKSFRQRITGISSSSSPSFEECQKRNMITAVSSSSRNSSLVQRKPHPGHHLQQQQKSLQLQRRPVRIPAAPVMPVTSPVILLHHPFHHHQQQQQQHRHQPQHLRLHPHHHWSYMQHRKLEFRKKPSPSCWILWHDHIVAV